MEQLKQEREELYGFTDEEQAAWGNTNVTDQLPSSLMESVEQARTEASAGRPMEVNLVPPSNDEFHIQVSSVEENYQPSHGLTHLSEDATSVNMVDVGHKTATKRIARAETRMILPPEVFNALQSTKEDEIVGPKGPIFATAKIAGIMAAK